jgi:hypothetical protein
MTGVHLRVYGQSEPQLIHSQIQTNVSDLPASRKVGGLHGHESKYFMCPLDKTPFFRLVDPDAFNSSSMIHFYCF